MRSTELALARLLPFALARISRPSFPCGTVTQRESGTSADVGYRELFVLRASGEEWRITSYMFNSPASEAE